VVRGDRIGGPHDARRRAGAVGNDVLRDLVDLDDRASARVVPRDHPPHLDGHFCSLVSGIGARIIESAEAHRPTRIAQTSLADGWRALRSNDPRAAEAIARSALRDDPQAMEFVELLAASYYHQGRFQEAIAPLKAVVDTLAPRGAGFSLAYC